MLPSLARTSPLKKWLGNISPLRSLTKFLNNLTNLYLSLSFLLHCSTKSSFLEAIFIIATAIECNRINYNQHLYCVVVTSPASQTITQDASSIRLSRAHLPNWFMNKQWINYDYVVINGQTLHDINNNHIEPSSFKVSPRQSSHPFSPILHRLLCCCLTHQMSMMGIKSFRNIISRYSG